MSKKKNQTSRQIVRQGDVILIPVDVDGGETELVPADARGIVLAEGETSGHYHAVFGTGVKLMRFKDARADRLLEIGGETAKVRVVGGGSGGVDRHTPITITGGKYLVRLQRSWTAEQTRQVQD